MTDEPKDLIPIPDTALPAPVEELPPPVPALSPEAEQDFVDVRQNLKNLAAEGEQAMADLLDVAKRGQDARSFEVVADLMRTVLLANKDLLDLHKKKVDLEIFNAQAEEPKKEEEKAPQNVTNNLLFVGSPDDLLRRLRPSEEDELT